MDSKAVVVSGEAPESDDETVSIATGTGLIAVRGTIPCGTIISGEAPESDDDRTSLSSVSAALDAAAVCPPYADAKQLKSRKSCVKYNSLLHKKLRECNEALDRDVLETCEAAAAASAQELAGVNRRLLKSELVLQEAAYQLRNAASRSRDASRALLQLADAEFLRSIRTHS